MGQVMKLHTFASDTDETISATVRALMSGRGVEVKDVAARIDMPKASLYNKLKGVAPWKASEIVMLARYFRVSIEELYNGLGGRFTPGSQLPRLDSNQQPFD